MIRHAKPLTALVYDRVYADVVNGAITGNDILTEASLVQQMQVSRAPVREALILLCEEGVLQAVPRMGYQVLQITPEQVSRLIEARHALEPFMLERAWDSIGEAQVGQLSRHLAQCRADEPVHTSVHDNWRRNIEFHLLLAGFSGNEYLLDSLRRVLKASARAANQYYLQIRGIPHGDGDLHDEILAGIRERDLEKTLATLRADLNQII
ncbi:MAG: GntR family transcriptional regulator [Clostridia bacterium]|nr:GntR family transcriptional regulator [Clostridia bacterium]